MFVLLRVITSRNKQTIQFEDGAINEQGTVAGTYIHGLFDSAGFAKLLNQLRAGKGLEPLAGAAFSYQQYKEQQFDILADAMRQHIDIERFITSCNSSNKTGVQYDLITGGARRKKQTGGTICRRTG